jgi:hypothetical protein
MWLLTALFNIRRISWWVWLIAFVPPLAFALHGHFTYAPLQRRLAEWELDNIGSYYPTLTGAFVASASTLVWAVPILAVALARLARQPEAAAPAAATAPAADAGANADDDARFERRVTLVTAAIVGAIPLVWGGVLWIAAARVGSLVEVDAGQLERGESPPGSYVRVLGRPLYDRAVATKQRGEQQWETTAYVPIVSGEWKPGAPVAAIVMAPSWKLEPGALLGELDASGTIDGGGLGIASKLFAQDQIALAPRVWVVELGNTPRNDLRKGQVLAALSLPLALFAWLVARRRARG